jgi:DNA mismatch repair protein MutL
VRQYRAVSQDGQRERRLGAICGLPFLEHALAIEWQHGDLTLSGWVADPLHTNPTLAEIQYCYVNGRMMRDRLINHAIRQACEDKLGADQQPAFVLYLKIDPHQVDVNVHPAKHEVRFHQSRLVHDFIYQGVLSVLQQQLEVPLAEEGDEPAPRQVPENRIAAGGNHFAQPAVARESAAPRYRDEPAAPRLIPAVRESPPPRVHLAEPLAACAARLSKTAGCALSPTAGYAGHGAQTRSRTGSGRPVGS